MKNKLKGLVKRRLLLLFSVAVVLSMVLTAFPLHVEVGSPSNAVLRIGGSDYCITIGNLVGAQEADYTCDGVADDETFQAALDALPSGGGQLFVLTGPFSWTPATTVTRAIDNVSIIGVGPAASFVGDGSTPIFTAGGDNWLFSNLETDAGGLGMGATTDWMWLHVTIGTTYYSLRTDSINIESHSTLHASGGADEIKLDDLGIPDDNSDLDSSTDRHGLLLKLGGGTTNFLRADGTWAAPIGTGDVTGPASSTNHAIVRFDGTGGKTIQDYTSNAPTVSDTGDMDIDGDLTVDNINVSGDVDGRDVSADGTKLDGIATGATVYPDTGEQAFLDADHTKLDGIDTGADVTGDNPPQAHTSSHGVSGSDTVFPADPDADRYLMWDDDPGQLSWESVGSGDMLKSTYDTDEDGDIDTAAGGTEWNSSAATGVVYIIAGAWGTRSTGITNTYILVVDGTPNDDEYARFTASGLEGRTESEFKGDYNLEIGTDVQAYDAELAAIAGLTSAADKVIYFTGSGTASTSDLTSFARSILDDAGEATFKATVNLEIGTDVQAWDTDLDDIAALSDADSNFIVGNGTSWVVESGATVRQSLGLVIGTDVQAYDAELSALAGLTSAADKVPYFTGSGTADVADLTSYGRSLIAVVNEAGFKQFVNLEIGTDVQAWDDDLDDIAALTPTNGNFIVGNGTDWTGRIIADSDIPDGICRDAELPEGVGIPDLEEKTSPIDDDLLLIIDTEEAPAESKKTLIGNLPLASSTVEAVTLYADIGSGDDSNPGTSGSPKETINGALDALPITIAHGSTICVRPGTYAESNEVIDFEGFNTLSAITLKVVNDNDEDMFDNGLCTSSSGTTITDDTKSWATDQFNDAYVWIFHGTGEGQIRQITDTTADTLSVATWTINPDTTSYFGIGGGATLSGTGTYHFLNSGKLVDFYGFRHTGATIGDIRIDNNGVSKVGYNYFTTSSVRGVMAVWGGILAGPDPQYNCSEATIVGFDVSSTSYAMVRGNLIDGAAKGIRVYYQAMVAGSATVYRQNHIQNCVIGISVESGSGFVLANSQSFGTGGDANGDDILPLVSTTVPEWWT